MQYHQFTVTQLVEDHWFRSWVIHHDKEADLFWTSWLKENPDQCEKVLEAREIIESLQPSKYALSEPEVAMLWSKIKPKQSPSADHEKNLSPRKWYWVAASVVVLALALPLFLLNNSSEIVYTTGYGETQTILLPDSSSVILNANSEIRFIDQWNSTTTREVWLEGEAFFDVQHKKNNKPFYVKTTEGVAVEVLGTTFNVYHRISETKVFLKTGRIKLTMPVIDNRRITDQVMMKPGELVEYTNKKYSKRMVASENYTAWTENKLVLDHTSLSEIVQLVKDNYGVELKIESDKLLETTVSGSIPMTDAESLLHNLSKAFQLKMEHEGDVVIFKEQ